jgi:hypothetical protein
MKIVFIFGPQAVGKMTVGHELEKITDLKLFHNHMTIDLVTSFFSYETDSAKKLVKLFRQEIFKEVAKSDLEGLIFTYVWAFDQQSNWDYINKVCDIFESKGGVAYFVELKANSSERIKRNKHPYRLNCKPNKRNLEMSEKSLKEYDQKFRLNSKNGEIKKENYIKINNTNLNAEKVAKIIKEKFIF